MSAAGSFIRRAAVVLVATLGTAASAGATTPLPATATYGSAALAAGSLPQAENGIRPGPAILYEPLARAPQLSNTPHGIWHAAPIMVSGASAYRHGEFLYQDFLYDDQGAGGSYTYPTGPAYQSHDLADLVEVRMRLTKAGTAFRVTYNSMSDPALVATTIALGSSPSSEPIPHGANASEPARVFVTVHGQTADAIDAASGTTIAARLPVTVDELRRQVQVIVPYAVFDSRHQTALRIAAAAGLWDTTRDAYLDPAVGSNTASAPGGAVRPDSAAFFNVAFRYAEPGGGLTGGFRDGQQGQALSTGDLSQFYADVDTNKLAAGVTDNMWGQPDGVPVSGFMDRIHVTRFTPAQGRGPAAPPADAVIGDPPGCSSPCVLQYAGALEPYEIYVPARPPGPHGYGLTLDLHGCGNPYNIDFDSARQQQLGDRGSGSIVIEPEARGDCYWYYGAAAADVFESWDDVAHRYRLDPDSVAISGISMGGYGTYKLASMFPDLFAAAAPVVPCPSAGVMWFPGSAAPGGEQTAIFHVIPSLRDLPVVAWHSANDEDCVYEGSERQNAIFDELDSLGYRYDAWTFFGTEHDSTAADAIAQSQPLADFLGSRTVDSDPAHITYVLNQSMVEPAFGLDPDHAYWLSGLKLANAAGQLPIGQIDVRSEGFGVGDPPALATQHGAGALTGGDVPAVPYVSQSRDWGPAPAAPYADRLDITAHNIASVTIDVRRAHVDCHVQLAINADAPLSVHLAGCRRHRHTRRKPK